MSKQYNEADEEVKNSELKNQKLTGKVKEVVQDVKEYLSDATKNSWEGTKGPKSDEMVSTTAERTKKSEDLPNKGEITKSEDEMQKINPNKQKNQKM